MKTKNELKTITYRLVTRQTPLSLMIDTGTAKKKPLLVWDEDKRENRAIRYASNQPSPFIDEQDENPVLSPIVFEDGFLIVDKYNPALQKFLTLHPKNGKLFEEINYEENAQEEIEFMDLADDASQIARNLDIDEAEKLARVLLGIDVNKMTSAEIKRDIRIYANNYPEEFLESIDDPNSDLENLISKAIDQRIIQFRNKNKDVYWMLPENKKRLTTIPSGVPHVTGLISFLKSNDGLEALDVIETMVE